MMPTTLFTGEPILANNLIYHCKEPGRNELITFPYPENESKTFLKMIIGLPGYTVKMKDEVLYFNGQKIKEKNFSGRIDQGMVDSGINPRDNLIPYQYRQILIDF